MKDDFEQRVKEFNRQYNITRRQSEIAPYVAQGYSNQQIADMFFLSRNTVKSCIYNMFQRIGVNRRADFVDIYPRYETRSPEVHENLTRREQQIFDMIGEGMTNEEIAEKLGLAKKTIKSYSKHLYSKMHISERNPRIYIMNLRNQDKTQTKI